jgi:hypothetical protein
MFATQDKEKPHGGHKLERHRKSHALRIGIERRIFQGPNLLKQTP